MKYDSLDHALDETLSGSAPEALHEQADRVFQALRPAARGTGAPPPEHERPARFAWLFWPGIGVAGAMAAAVLLFSLLFSPTLSWAQVVEHFRTLSFFGITVYFAPDRAHPPEKIEIWATSEHRSRVQYRGLILLGEGEKPVRILRASTGEELPLAGLSGKSPNDPLRQEYPALDAALGMQASLSQMPSFSLDELLKTFSGKREDLRPVPNVEAGFASDLQVFDFPSPASPEWLRLWVLRKSELPVRIRSLDPRQGGQIEAVFDYFTRMPEEAFDAVQVSTALHAKQGGANKLYALLKDPGGRPLTPEDLFAQHGLHLPEIAAVGRTEDGVLWVQSRHAQNRRADGSTFAGWGKLTDDLGQTYLRVDVGSGVDGDFQEEYYVPLNYHTGFRRPASYRLTCQDRQEGFLAAHPPSVVGSVEVPQWQEGAPVPGLFPKQTGLTPPDFTRRVLRHLLDREDWVRFDALAATIAGAPEESPLALYRDVLRTQKLDLVQQREAAVALRTRLYPLLARTMKTGAPEEWPVMADHLCDMVRACQIEAARPLANRYAADLPVQREIHLAIFVMKLKAAGLKEDELRKFFDEDVLSIPRVQEELKRAQSYQRDAGAGEPPRSAAGRAALAQLSDRYRGETLPADCAFFEADPALSKDQSFTPCPLPGHSEYRSLAGWRDRGFAADPNRRDTWDRPRARFRHRKAAASPVRLSQHADLGRNLERLLEPLSPRDRLENRRGPALVAHYDGRPLPNCYEVPPLESGVPGLAFRQQEGGTNHNAAHVLEAFAEALNSDLAPHDPRRVILVDETGLPTAPGPNQSWANICLADQFAFWPGRQANAPAWAWFRDNFGITFTEEERDLKGLEIRPAP